MDEAKPEVAIDIGGGEGEFFLRLAKENPQKAFIVLDPEVTKIKEAPPNLHFICWRTDIDSRLPFLSKKIDEAHINFLFGKIGAEDDEDFESLGKRVGKFRNLLKDLKNVLKQGAKLHINDARGNIDNIMRILKEEGYQVVQGPKRIADENKTWWAKTFADGFKVGGRKEEESLILPMELETIWVG